MAAWNPRANDIFLQAVEAETPQARAALLDASCAGDATLRRQVEALLKAHDDAGSFLDHPPAGAETPDADATRTGADGDPGTGPALGFLEPPRRPGFLGRFRNYEVQSVVGSGGMGVVLKAVDESLDRVVAIKLLHPNYAANATARERFVREAKAVAAVTHEHVVTVHAVERDEPVPHIVMQFVHGVSLQERVDRGGPLEVKEVLRVGMQVAQGLAAAHAQGIVHRDIKPANILLENGVERVKITDFGLARAVYDASLTQSGVISGTPMFMSPEQAAGEAVDHRSDLFSLGSVLYFTCTGRPPFRASGTMAVLKRVIEDAPRRPREVNPDVPDWLDAIILKLLAKDPAARFQSAKEVAELLGQHLAHLQQPALVPMPPRVVPAAGLSRSRPAPLVPALLIAWPMAVLVLLVALGFGGAAWGGVRLLMGCALLPGLASIAVGVVMLTRRGRSVREAVPAVRKRRRRLVAEVAAGLSALALLLLALWLGPELVSLVRGTGMVQLDSDDRAVSVEVHREGRMVLRLEPSTGLLSPRAVPLPSGSYDVYVVPQASNVEVTGVTLLDEHAARGAASPAPLGAVEHFRLELKKDHVVTIQVATARRPAGAGPRRSARLDGHWDVVREEIGGAEVDARHRSVWWEIAGGKRRLKARAGDEPEEHEILVDPTHSPPTLDLLRDKVVLARGIYRLEGDTLTVCLAAPPAPRPETFATGSNPKLTLTVLRRRVTGSIAGEWTSDRGDVTLQHDPPADGKSVTVGGTWKSGGSDVRIQKGVYDPTSGRILAAYRDGPNDTFGSVELRVVFGGKAITGRWRSESGERGFWTMWRKGQAPPPAPGRGPAGEWDLPLGTLHLECPASTGGRPVPLTGKYSVGGKSVTIRSGSFDPNLSLVRFSGADVNGVTFDAQLVLSPDGRELIGDWSNSKGELGTWALTRQEMRK